MQFRDNEAIYLQIADYVSNNILSGKWPAEQKLPAVRELAIDLQVNLNTVLRSYEFLQNLGVIYNKRGLGLFVAQEGYKKIKAHRKEKFVREDLPLFFTNIHLLDITTAEIMQWYEQFKGNNNENKQ
jgi:DNA-binding transcriptional regulator YhcF (GntR family)